MTTRKGAIYYTGRSELSSLISTDESTSGLHGAVQPNDYKHYARLGKILGLGNKKAVKDWMACEAFRPVFERLDKGWIEPPQDAASQSGKPCPCGPDLWDVADAIDDPRAVA